MIEIWLFGRLVATLTSAVALVLLLIALTSITYLAMTLTPVLRLADARGREADRAARRVGLGAAAGAFLLALIGLRVGAPGLGGELLPTLALAITAAATLGSGSAFAVLGGGRALVALGEAEAKRASTLAGEREGEAQRLLTTQRAYHDGEDLHAELDEAEAAVARLAGALAGLAATRDEVNGKLAALEESTTSDLGRALRRTRDEVATKLELGEKIHRAARAAAFRMATAAPVTLLLRRRPRRVAQDLSGIEPAAVPARLAEIEAALDAFLRDAEAARATLEAIDREAWEELASDEENPVDQGRRDVEAVASAYRAVRERLDVVRVRLAAQAQVDEVASAAGELRERALASGLPAADLKDLVDEVVRAESAILMATPAELDGHRLVETLERGTDALGGRDGASLDALLKALRELA